MKRLGALLASVVLTAGIVGCAMETDPATNVTGTSAVLHGKVSCKPGEQGINQWRYRSRTNDPPADVWHYTEPGSWACPSSGLNNQPVSKTITGLQPGTHYYYEQCGLLTVSVDGLPTWQKYCAGRNGIDHKATEYAPSADDFYTPGPLRLDSGVPNAYVYAAHGLTLSTWKVSGSFQPAKPGCCASGYFAPAEPDLTTRGLYGARSFWNSSCDPAKIRVVWLNEPTVGWQGLSVIGGCHINDPTACAGGSCAWIWLNCWNQTTKQCDLRVPPWSFNKTWCNVITHEFGHQDGRLHSTDPTNIMYPFLATYKAYNPNGAWNCAGE